MGKEIETPEISSKLPLSEFSIDLLQNLSSGIDIDKESPADESKDIELNLGLSLGGYFGVNPSEKRLVRSSSIVGIKILQSEKERLSSAASGSISSVLMSACSVPTEAEEERRKRKEIHSLRRMELKRRRTEKKRNSLAARRASLEKNNEEDMSGQDEGLVAESVALNGFRWRSQGSLGSQGDSSLTVSDFNSRHSQGLSSCMEAGSSMSGQHSPKQIEQKPVIAPTKLASTSNTWDNPSYNLTVDDELVMEKGRNVMKGMPSVSTRVEGPNGKKIEGFLYKYRDGEEVRIVCLCHGSFLSPAEFVKHAGGGDVAHPLRHIVVNTSFSSFL